MYDVCCWEGGGGLEPGIILYTSHFLFSVTCVTFSKLYLLGDPPVKFNGRKREAWMLDWQAVWAVPFFIHRTYRGFGVKVVSE